MSRRKDALIAVALVESSQTIYIHIWVVFYFLPWNLRVKLESLLNRQKDIKAEKAPKSLQIEAKDSLKKSYFWLNLQVERTFK